MRARACFLLAAVAVAGCGAEATGQGSSDTAIARRAVLRLTDLPHGWKRHREQAGGGGQPACRLTRAQRMATGWANSASFTRGHAQEIDSAVYVYRDAATARRVFARVTAPGAWRCYESGERAAVDGTPGVKVLLSDVERAGMAPLGDQRADVRVKVVYTDRGAPSGAVFDLEFVRVGRGVVVNFYSRVFRPLAAALRRSATGAEVRRLSDALADRT
jgi:hypothetical protein